MYAVCKPFTSGSQRFKTGEFVPPSVAGSWRNFKSMLNCGMLKEKVIPSKPYRTLRGAKQAITKLSLDGFVPVKMEDGYYIKEAV